MRLAATFLAAVLILSTTAQAMEIQLFDKMDQDDRAEYVSALIRGAEKALTDAGKPDQAGQVRDLFNTNPPDGNISIGMSDFMLTLAKARLADAQRAEKDPNARRVQVEDAMAVMLKKLHGIELPQSLFSAAKDFKPRHPLQK
jgi:hypothetical protein